MFAVTISLDSATAKRFDRLLDLLEALHDEPAQQTAIDGLTARLAVSRNKTAAAIAATTSSQS